MTQKETLEEASEKYASKELNNELTSKVGNFYGFSSSFAAGAKWQQEQDSNWFNEYQKVEDYIIDKIGDKFLEATPEKYKTASEATIALLENNWQQERMYSEEEVFTICRAFATFVQRNGPSYKKQQEWFEQNKKK